MNKNLEILSKNHNSGRNGTFIIPLSREKRQLSFILGYLYRKVYLEILPLPEISSGEDA